MRAAPAAMIEVIWNGERLSLWGGGWYYFWIEDVFKLAAARNVRSPSCSVVFGVVHVCASPIFHV